jgi:hypothetical protein
MSVESERKWAEECIRAADLIDEECVDWLDAIEQVWRSTKDRREVRSFISWTYHADGGPMHEEPGAWGAANILREWGADLLAHVALVERLTAERAAAATS